MKGNYRFNTYKITSQKDLCTYKAQVKKVDYKNPFYLTDLLKRTEINPELELCYHLLNIDEVPFVLLPFLKRKINHKVNNIEYFDVISPYGYSGPLYDKKTTCNDTIALFWEYVDNWSIKENIISEFIRFSLNDNSINYSGTLIPTLKNVRGKLIDKELQWGKLKSKVRNNYRKAVQANLKLEIFTKENINPTVIDTFYNIYISTMKRNNAHEMYFYTKEYFENFVNNNPGYYAFAIVFHENKAISTELILINENTLYSFLGGTLSDYFHTRPNDFLKIEVMNWGREQNYEYYSLGGGREDNDPLYKYKKTFFPKEEDVIYYTGRKIINSNVYEQLVKIKCKQDYAVNSTNIAESFFPYYRKND